MKGEAGVLAVPFAGWQEADTWPVCCLSPEGLCGFLVPAAVSGPALLQASE